MMAKIATGVARDDLAASTAKRAIQIDSTPMLTFAEVRQRAGFSQRAMARFVTEETGKFISQTDIHFIETGERNPPKHYLKAIRVLAGDELDAGALALLNSKRHRGESISACLRRLLGGA